VKPTFKVDENLPGEVAALFRQHGYDAVTQMQETKVTLCRIEAA